jgi:hypothetical protein
MIPMSQDTFVFDEIKYFRIRFAIDAAGQVTGLIGIYGEGRTDSSPRTSD